jgi:hypothetical protein
VKYEKMPPNQSLKLMECRRKKKVKVCFFENPRLNFLVARIKMAHNILNAGMPSGSMGGQL